MDDDDLFAQLTIAALSAQVDERWRAISGLNADNRALRLQVAELLKTNAELMAQNDQLRYENTFLRRRSGP